MGELNNKKNEYPQKVYNLLANPEFREYLKLIYKDSDGDEALFALDVLKNLGSKTKEYLERLILVGRKEYELSESED